MSKWGSHHLLPSSQGLMGLFDSGTQCSAMSLGPEMPLGNSPRPKSRTLGPHSSPGILPGWHLLPEPPCCSGTPHRTLHVDPQTQSCASLLQGHIARGTTRGKAPAGPAQVRPPALLSRGFKGWQETVFVLVEFSGLALGQASVSLPCGHIWANRARWRDC